MKNWDKILDDFARKCKGGAPDMTNPRHLALLRESLLRFGWNENAANEIVGNLREGYDAKEKAYLKGLGKRPWGKDGNPILVSTALNYGKKSGKRYRTQAYLMAIDLLKSDAKNETAQSLLGQVTADEPEEKPKETPVGDTDPTMGDKKTEEMIRDGEKGTKGRVDRKGHGDIKGRIDDAKTEEDEMAVLEDIDNKESDNIDNGYYGPGGGSASFGEDRYTQATNEHLEGIDPEIPTQEEKDTYDENKKNFNKPGKKAKKKRRDYAEEMGLMTPSERKKLEKDCDGGNETACQNLRDVDDQAAEEMAKREAWATRENKELTEAKPPKKVWTQKSALAKSHKKKMDWLRTAYDGGRSTKEDLLNDSDYGPMDPDKPHTTMIMSKANQKSVRALLVKKLKDCGKDQACKTHYKKQLEVFDEGMGDHDTGAVYYDVDGNLRFVNISNKKSKSMKDPHKNQTVESIIPILDEEMARQREERPGLTDEGAQKAAQIIASAMDDAVEMSVEANKIVQQSIDKEAKVEDDPGVGAAIDRLPGTKDYQRGEDGRKYVDAAKNHKRTQAKLKELYGDPPYSDAQVAQAVLESIKENNPPPPHDPFGKLVLKMGAMHNKVKNRYKELTDPPPDGQGMTPKQAYKQMAKDSDGVYTAKELRAIHESEEMKKFGEIHGAHQSAMKRAHKEVVSGAKKADREYLKHLTKKCKGGDKGACDEKDRMDKGENGPHTEAYIRTFMEGMHWDKYIDGQDGEKMINMGGYNVKPAAFRNCLAKLSGYTDDPPKGAGPEPKGEKEKKEWREKLKDHMGKNIQIEAGTNAVYILSEKIDPETGKRKKIYIGEDTWRQAGDSKKIAGHIGDDMIDCIKEENSIRKKKQKSKK